MVTLAIDTSHPIGSAALARDGAAIGEVRFDPPASHLVELSKAVERLLRENQMTVRDVDQVAVVIGPGSFTGVRIGLAFAKGLAAAGAGLVAIESLRLLALPLIDAGRERVCAMIDAKRGEVYAAVYERRPHGEVVTSVAARVLSTGEFLDGVAAAPDAFVGTGALAHHDEIERRFPRAKIADETHPSAAYLASVAHHLPRLDRDDVRALEPAYVRPSGAERKRLRSLAPEAGNDG